MQCSEGSLYLCDTLVRFQNCHGVRVLPPNCFDARADSQPSKKRANGLALSIGHEHKMLIRVLGADVAGRAGLRIKAAA